MEEAGQVSAYKQVLDHVSMDAFSKAVPVRLMKSIIG